MVEKSFLKKLKLKKLVQFLISKRKLSSNTGPKDKPPNQLTNTDRKLHLNKLENSSNNFSIQLDQDVYFVENLLTIIQTFTISSSSLAQNNGECVKRIDIFIRNIDCNITNQLARENNNSQFKMAILDNTSNNTNNMSITNEITHTHTNSNDFFKFYNQKEERRFQELVFLLKFNRTMRMRESSKVSFKQTITLDDENKKAKYKINYSNLIRQAKRDAFYF